MRDEPDPAGVEVHHADTCGSQEPDEVGRRDSRLRDVRENDVGLDRRRAQRDARHGGQQLTEIAGPPVVVLDSVDHRVQGDEARSRSDPRPVHGPATQAVHHRLCLFDDGLAAGQHRAERSRETLVEREDDRVRGRGELRERHAERDGRVDEPGAVDVHPAVVPLGGGGERLGQLRPRRPSRRRGCACSRGSAVRRGGARRAPRRPPDRVVRPPPRGATARAARSRRSPSTRT